MPQARRAVVALLAFAVVAVAAPVQAQADVSQSAATAPAGVILRLAPGAAVAATLGAVADRFQVGSVTPLPELDRHAVALPPEQIGEAIRALAAVPGVTQVEPDERVATAVVEPGDPLWEDQWGPETVQAPWAWRWTTGSSEVVVAVLDTGVADHADLDGALLQGRNLLDGTDDTDDDHFVTHGTGVAGVLAARGDNDEYIAGLCWSCSVLPIKVLDATGAGYNSTISAGIVEAANRGARVINLSLGSFEDSPTMQAAVEYAQARGALVVAAAGNAGSNQLTFPAAFPGVVAVAATTPADTLESFSNYGDWVDVAAPGCALTLAGEDDSAEQCGTSFSAPMVAGAAALAFAAAPEVSADVIADALVETADPIGGGVRGGRLDVDAFLAAVAGPPIRTIDGACPAGEVPRAEFADVVGGVHAPAIDCLAWLGITLGVEPASYRPAEPVRRDQMASFLIRLLTAADIEVPEPAGVSFPDVTGSTHANAIAQLAELGVVEGRTDGTYGPAEPVRREQMATFLARVQAVANGEAPQARHRYFDDIGDGVHSEAILAMADAGVASGRGQRMFDPLSAVRRDQMATFLARELDLLRDSGEDNADEDDGDGGEDDEDEDDEDDADEDQPDG